MNDDEKFFFDLEGYLILKNVLSADEVAHCNEAIDHHSASFFETDRTLEGESKVLGGGAKQKWMEGMLAWQRPWCEPFRDLMVHPRVGPYLAEVLEGTYRLDHGPLLIAMNKGEGGHYMHGGAVERQDFSQTFMYQFGKMHCGLTVVEFVLADEGPGDGGLAIVPCSHKSNFPLPQSLSFYEEHQEYVQEINVEAGDVVIFTEAMTHGTLVWQGEHQRRALIYKYSPRFQYLAEGYHQTIYPDFIQDMTEEQRALMPPPA
jgi:hypothetical protein